MCVFLSRVCVFKCVCVHKVIMGSTPFEMNDVNNDGVVDVKDVAQLVSDMVYKRTSNKV